MRVHFLGSRALRLVKIHISDSLFFVFFDMLLMLKIPEHPVLSRILWLMSHQKPRPHPAWVEAQKRPPPMVQAAQAAAQRNPSWLAEAGLEMGDMR